MITSPLLATVGAVLHQFGTKQSSEHSPSRSAIVSKQVHGNRCLWVRSRPEERPEGFDALLTDRAGMPIGVSTADCLPILLVDRDHCLVAAVHAGWRGTLARVVQKAVAEMVQAGGVAENLLAAIGPSIQGSCYEVGSEVATPFRDLFPGGLRDTRKDKWLLDLPLVNRLQLLEAGLRAEQIDHLDLCTHCRPDLFHSYRRDGPGAGRMTSFIQILP